MTGLRTGRPRDHGSIFDRSLNTFLLYSVQNSCAANTPSYWAKTGVKRQRNKADNIPPARAEINYGWSCIFTPPHAFKMCTATTVLVTCIMFGVIHILYTQSVGRAFCCLLQNISSYFTERFFLFCKRQSNPITGLKRPWGFQKFEAPRFQDNQHMKVVRLSALRTGSLYPPGNIPGTHFC